MWPSEWAHWRFCWTLFNIPMQPHCLTSLCNHIPKWDLFDQQLWNTASNWIQLSLIIFNIQTTLVFLQTYAKHDACQFNIMEQSQKSEIMKVWPCNSVYIALIKYWMADCLSPLGNLHIDFKNIVLKFRLQLLQLK